MVHIEFNAIPTHSVSSPEILPLYRLWRIQDTAAVYRIKREYQNGGFGDPDKHPNVWAVAVLLDGQWARVHNTRGQGREWSNLDRLEKWLREQGINQWVLVNHLEPHQGTRVGDEYSL